MKNFILAAVAVIFLVLSFQVAKAQGRQSFFDYGFLAEEKIDSVSAGRTIVFSEIGVEVVYSERLQNVFVLRHDNKDVTAISTDGSVFPKVESKRETLATEIMAFYAPTKRKVEHEKIVIGALTYINPFQLQAVTSKDKIDIFINDLDGNVYWKTWYWKK